MYALVFNSHANCRPHRIQFFIGDGKRRSELLLDEMYLSGLWDFDAFPTEISISVPI